AFPLRNHLATCTPRSRHDHAEARAGKSVSLESGFAIVLPVVKQCEGNSTEHQRGVLEIQSAIGQRLLPFGGIVGDPHWVLYAYANSKRQDFRGHANYRAVRRMCWPEAHRHASRVLEA